MTQPQIEIIKIILQSKYEEILNYDMDDPDAEETLGAISECIVQLGN
jgi:hypothetical protein